MSDTIVQDTTSQPHHGIRRRPANDANDSDSASNSDIDKISPRSHSQQSSKSRDTSAAKAAGGSNKVGGGFRSSIFGRHHRTHKEGGPDSDSDSDDGHGRKRGRRRKRIAASASHLLAQAPAIPDQRFDTNYRKALNQIYETYAHETVLAQGTAAIAVGITMPSKASQLQSQHQVRAVPSIAARIAVMTLRDIIIMPFIQGFFWGFGTILLTMANQRSLGYHLRRTWRLVLGGNADEVPVTIRGEPARVRRTGQSGLGGIGLVSAGSGFGGPGPGPAGGFGRSSTTIY
ncbi:hypothetical protein BGZ65_004905 [Modicella reniformis]|uniref:Uncharacterized protein n=1 Tax=Modicella reniformis TaxID=1440133 RepID=A0A9P6M3H3_9FUNG|nr:hypothetical protein BGZ65_004905 [Modicella reniformis]